MFSATLSKETESRSFSRERDLRLINEWAHDHDLPPMPISFLPKKGFVISIGEKSVMAGFVYTTDSAVSFVENIISNPSSTRTERDLCLAELINESERYAKETGACVLYVRSPIASLISNLKNNGFEEILTNVSLLIRRI